METPVLLALIDDFGDLAGTAFGCTTNMDCLTWPKIKVANPGHLDFTFHAGWLNTSSSNHVCAVAELLLVITSVVN